jgi:hypothetical protein
MCFSPHPLITSPFQFWSWHGRAHCCQRTLQVETWPPMRARTLEEAVYSCAPHIVPSTIPIEWVDWGGASIWLIYKVTVPQSCQVPGSMKWAHERIPRGDYFYINLRVWIKHNTRVSELTNTFPPWRSDRSLDGYLIHNEWAHTHGCCSVFTPYTCANSAVCWFLIFIERIQFSTGMSFSQNGMNCSNGLKLQQEWILVYDTLLSCSLITYRHSTLYFIGNGLQHL